MMAGITWLFLLPRIAISDFKPLMDIIITILQYFKTFFIDYCGIFKTFKHFFIFIDNK